MDTVKIQRMLCFLSLSFVPLTAQDSTPWIQPEFEVDAMARFDQRGHHALGTLDVSVALSDRTEIGLLARTYPKSCSLRGEWKFSDDLQEDPVASSGFLTLGNALPWNIGFDRYELLSLSGGLRVGKHLWVTKDSYFQLFGSAGVLVSHKKNGTDFFQGGARFGWGDQHALRADAWIWNRAKGELFSLLYSYTLESGATWSLGGFVSKKKDTSFSPGFSISYSIPL